MAQTWVVVGGAGEDGGILVRHGEAFHSPLCPQLLSTGAEVEELELRGDRMRYRLLEGSGPSEGWVCTSFRGRELLIPQPAPREPPPEAVGEAGEPSLPLALLFPGQGSQYVTMLEGAQRLPAVREMLEKAEGILGYDILKLCQEGPEKKLEETRHCQPAMFLGGLAAVERLRGEREEAVLRARSMAGFSLGEYTALCAAGVFTFEDALRLVKLRGEAMHEAAEVGSQKMLSVIGLEEEELKKLCAAAAKKAGRGSTCQIAISMFPKGFSVGGTERAVRVLQELAEQAGAAQAKLIKTAGAFHTPLMEPAMQKLAVALEEVLPNMKPPLHSVWMNASAEPLRPGCDPKQIVQLLKRQLTKPVLWQRLVSEMVLEDDIEEFYELGPSKQLKSMMKRINPDAAQNMESIDPGVRTRPPLPSEVGPNEEPPLPVALLFAGQGSQYLRMLEGVKDLPAVQDMLETAKSVLGYDLFDLCQDGPEDRLSQTSVNQAVLFVGGLAGLEKLRVENPEVVNRASIMAGFSVGEYAALCAAGVFTFEDGLSLVQIRGAAMEEAEMLAEQTMFSVVGLEKGAVESCCREAAKRAGPEGVCQIAIELFASGFSVSCTSKAASVFKDLAQKAGAQQVKAMRAGGGFHTSLMQPAYEKLSDALEDMLPNMCRPVHTVFMSASPDPVLAGSDPECIVENLKRHLVEPYSWSAMMNEIIEYKITSMYEIGPSKALRTIMKRIDAAAWKAMENVETGTRPRPPPPAQVGPKGLAPLPAAVLFPGQGSQYSGMLRGVKDVPAVRDLLARAGPVLGYDVLEAAGREDAWPNHVAAPLMYVAGLAGLEVLRSQNEEAVERAAAFVGFSVGEYAALCAAGVFSFEVGLAFLKARGEAMTRAAEAQAQAMMSVVGLERAKLEPLCKDAAGPEGVCEVALQLFPAGLSVGGTLEAIQRLEPLAMKAGAQQAKVIGTTAFHTALMQGAAEELAGAFDELLKNMKSPMHSVWMSASSEPVRPGCNPKDIVSELKRQLTQHVNWEKTLKELIKELNDESAKFWEVGPSKQLKQMMKRVDQAVWKNTENVEV